MSQLKKDATAIDQMASPSIQQYQSIRQFILSQDDYDPATDELRFLDRQFRDRQFSSVIEISESLRSIWQLSPKFHYLTGSAAIECGRLELAKRSQYLFQVCLDFLLQTGDGSMQKPYEITYFSDIQDILAILDADVRCQQVVNRDGCVFDVATLHNGEDIWFNADPLNKKINLASREQAKIAV